MLIKRLSILHNIKSEMDFFAYFPLDSIDDILIILDNPVLFLDLPLESYSEILNSGRYLHFLLVNPIISPFFLKFLFQTALKALNLPEFYQDFTVLFLKIVESFFDIL